MNSIDINGFTFHEVEEGRDYQWKLECGPQPLDKIEEVVSYRGQDILTYYFVKKLHMRSSELVNPRVDWGALNEKCRQDLLRIMGPLDLERYVRHTKFGKTYRKEIRYLMGFLQFIATIYYDMISAYEKILQHDVTKDAFLLKTCHMEKGEIVPHNTMVILCPFEEWLKRHGMDQYREMQGIDKEAEVVVLVNKDLCDGSYKLDVPFVCNWKELVS
ncbi:MAG: hypothetical protein IJT01_13805 [Selenomonadaceae bacterium]|nr:hypothetical protein [Selenomonadaceae bacterium]